MKINKTGILILITSAIIIICVSMIVMASLGVVEAMQGKATMDGKRIGVSASAGIGAFVGLLLSTPFVLAFLVTVRQRRVNLYVLAGCTAIFVLGERYLVSWIDQYFGHVHLLIHLLITVLLGILLNIIVFRRDLFSRQRTNQT
jgi:hypothetical protein